MNERFLWLAFERPPHPDAVVVAAGEMDLRFVLELFSVPPGERRRFAVQFRSYVARQADATQVETDTVASRLPSGVVHLISWRLAKWLSHVLPADDSVIERTAKRIRHWLKIDRSQPVLRPPFAKSNK